MNHRVEHLSNGVAVHLGDSSEILPALRGIDCLITSPPYQHQRDYGRKIGDWQSLVRCLSLTQDGGETQILVNLGMIHRDGEVVEYWDDLKRDMKSAGWRLFGWYVWDQGPGMMGDWAGRLAPSHEWIFHFNRVAVKPNKTRPCSFAGYVRQKPQTGMRKANGSMSGWSHGLAPTQSTKIPDSVIRIMRHKHTGGIESGHPAIYPVDFAAELILAYSSEGQLICDPFMGSGSTGVAAVNSGRKFVGVEIEPKYFDIACRRIQAALDAPDMFIEQPKPLRQEGLF